MIKVNPTGMRLTITFHPGNSFLAIVPIPAIVYTPSFNIFINMIKYNSYESMTRAIYPVLIIYSTETGRVSSDEDESGKSQKEQLAFTGEKELDQVDCLFVEKRDHSGPRSQRRRSQVSITNLLNEAGNHIRPDSQMGPVNESLVSVSRTQWREEPHTLADVSFKLVRTQTRQSNGQPKVIIMKFSQGAVLLVAGLLGGAGLLGAGMYLSGMSMGQGTTVVQQPSDNNQNQGSNMVTVDRVDVKADLGYTVSSGQALLIQKKDAPASERPEYWGDYVEFSSSEAKSGLRPGKDYYEVSLNSSSSITFSNVKPGDYVLVIEDNSGTRVIHDYFKKGISIDSKVPQYKVDGGSTATQYINVNPDAVQTVKSDQTTILDASQNGLSIGTDLGISGNNTDVVRYVKRTVTLENGKAYLGDMTFSNVKARSDVVSMELVETSVDGSAVSDASDIVLYNSETGVDKVESDGKWNYLFGQSSNPTKVGNKVSFLVKLNYDSGTGSVTADDGTLQDGEAVFDSVMNTIYDSALGDGAQTITG